MLAPQLLKSGRGVSGSAFFVDGMSSAADPMFISDRAYRHAENVLHRGGLVRTRPGYRQIFELPDGVLQGLAYFRPISGEGRAAVSIGGKVYTSAYPFGSYAALAGVQLYASAPRTWSCVATRSAQRNADGTVQAIEPRKVLIVQDGGFTRAAYWDGISSGHIDPTTTLDGAGNVLTSGTPLGGPMAWSGDRLWVARGNKLFASDISDPFSFVENQYAAGGGFFLFDEDITALVELPSLTDPVLLVFTANKTWRILSSIRDRSVWQTTDKFQAVFFPEIGCASQRGLVTKKGILWWMSATGLTNLNAAEQAFISSKLVPQDLAMSVSKSNLSPDLSAVALGTYENFLLVSVPYGSRYNTHTWVLDQSVSDDRAAESWAGIWTGTQPVEWASGPFGGVPRIVYVSKDYDGKNRLWEAFVPDRKDNDAEIQCFVETKTHIDFSERATGLNRKNFLWAEVTFTDVQGTVDVELYWAGTRGKYKLLGEYTLVATEGPAAPEFEASDTDALADYRSQQRVLRGPEIVQDPAATCSSFDIESKSNDWLDIGFSLLIRWTGRAALQSYRLFVDPYEEPGTGEGTYVETGPKVLSGSVCS